MSTRAFVRQLGAQPGVQLNPLADATDGVAPDQSDQIFAVVARMTRGRIDRPFLVNRGNFLARTGPAESIRTNALNEAKLQAYEALQNGALGCVVERLVPAAAAKSYAVVNFSGTPVGSATVTAFSVSSTAPTSNYSLYLMHHGCFNDGIKVGIHADSTPIGGTAVANKMLTLRVWDSNDVLLHEFYGSLNAGDKDDSGQSIFLPDVAARLTQEVDIAVAATQTVATGSDAYGRGTDGTDKWAKSSVLNCFSEGGTTYATTDYDAAINGLKNSNTSFGYVISGGTQVTALLGKLAAMAIEINVPLKIDLAGTLTPSAAITLMQSLALDSHLVHVNWAPVESDDPLNGGRQTFGTGGLQAGYSCSRNARINAKGFAPKNAPVAGKAWPLNRTGMRQTYFPTEQELSDLARSQINPVVYEQYNGGGRFVFTDCLTSSKSLVSYKKLQTVAEMSQTLDNWVTMYAKELTQLPMRQFIKRMNDFMDILLNGAATSEWLVPSKNLANNAPFAFTVAASDVRPADLALINYWTSFDGVARQVIVQQTLTR